MSNLENRNWTTITSLSGGRCYSVCIDDTCKWISHILSRIIGPPNTPTKIRVPILDTGHMA